MFIAFAVIGILLALALTASAVGDITRAEAIVASLSKVGVPDSWYVPLGLVKIAGAAGLVIGLWVPFLGAAAAIGVILYFIGALIMHLRAKDKGFAPVILFIVLAAAALVLRLASA
ncbi:DoxX family protein [Streptomyces paludis]|uniref:DoxX family protein n=1 Tax=Streptomyces paludis TaxID=2282738 RepID=A0A345HTI1_9ACTN|nr:DoxX family protein [Streptomyces paludis]AXG80005.1 DoxX family protein [Streptomyces paludis]